MDIVKSSDASSMPTLPPGPRFLLQHLHYIAIPPTFTLFITNFIARFFGQPFPTWAALILSIVSFPAFFFGYLTLEEFRWRRAAAAHGATLPRIARKSDMASAGEAEHHFPRDFLFRLCEKYGNTLLLEILFVKRFFTTEPEYIKAVLATDFNSFEKGDGFRSQMKSLLGVGVFNADGDLWKFHRSMARPFFSKDRISHFDIFDRHALDALQQMKSRLREGYAVDWQDLVSRFTLDSATEFLFGKDVRSLATGLPYPPTSEIARRQTIKPDADEFASTFLEAQIASSKRGRFQQAWGLKEFWQDRVQAKKATIDKFINPILVDALRKKAEKGPDSDTKVSEDDTLLSQLLKVTDDYNIIHDETLNILLAGRDTTACTLTFAVYRLAEHPDVLQRLREEILSVVGPTRRPTYDDIRNMKYLRAVINETLRLYPPVPVNIRCAVKDTVLQPKTPGEEPIFLPNGMRVIYSVFMMHRRKDLWGPDALKFDPDRFLDERVQKYLTPNPFIFLPFNAGPRICLGQQFAYNEASFMLVRLLQQFSAITFVPEVAPESVPPPGYADSPGSDGSDRVWIGTHLTMYAKGGLWVKMTEAQNE
ncbi:cytochrome P450 monooxygenase pc-2 [Cubamyces lactineus]|nr:cytochrome P450 monooxygenase pc-2 [Cubamyces lactineus]